MKQNSAGFIQPLNFLFLSIETEKVTCNGVYALHPIRIRSESKNIQIQKTRIDFECRLCNAFDLNS